MAKKVREVKETRGLIVEAQAEYGALINEAHDYWEQAKALRNHAMELIASGSTDSQTAIEISQLLRASYIHQFVGR